MSNPTNESGGPQSPEDRGANESDFEKINDELEGGSEGGQEDSFQIDDLADLQQQSDEPLFVDEYPEEEERRFLLTRAGPMIYWRGLGRRLLPYGEFLLIGAMATIAMIGACVVMMYFAVPRVFYPLCFGVFIAVFIKLVTAFSKSLDE